jgi:hypothetical protein
MRNLLVALSLLLGSATSADAQVSVHVGVGVALPGVQIGIHVPAYPHLVAVPGYPVYYAPHASSNYFFYDGAYWVFHGDSWYVSSWYAGPWYPVAPDHVPVYVLRVPVRYYRAPPPYFRGWRASAAPRWGERWGRDWEHRRAGWVRWDRRSVPRPAPLPAYQRSYSGDRYPVATEKQHEIRTARYAYRPREEVTRQHYGAPHGSRDEHVRNAPTERRAEGKPPPRGDGRGKRDERGRDHR